MMLGDSNTVAVSPSLLAQSDGIGPAFELKFLVDEALARDVECWARSHLMPDPHGDPVLGGAYDTTTLYCDTAALDVFHRAPSYRRRKFRIRRYGSEEALFLERKSKSGDRVAKRRVAIRHDELPVLAHPVALASWPGHWFHQSLLMRRLRPACLVAYRRTAFVGAQSQSGLRLTLDRNIRANPTEDWRVPELTAGTSPFQGQVILEMKFRLALPMLFRRLIEEMRLSPVGVSKYRRCQEAWFGTNSRVRENGHA